MTNKNKLTTEIFDDKEAAENAYRDAIKQGYKPEEINVLMSSDTRKKYYDSDLVTKETGDKSMEGLAIGGALGGTIGGTIGAIAAIGTSLVFPGLGLIIAGPLVAGLAGAGAGSISGGLIGALVGWGIPEERAKVYEQGIKSGGIVLGVNETTGRGNLETDWKKYKTEKTL
ncbi:MAG: hypothetical protein H0W64_09395 [Gammaproteobacteria bacterium]|nr:hypothetical protein [Gammaproteobacteria bacterium]